MADSQNPEDKEYKGPGKFTAALGKASVNGTIGAGAGVVTGAAIGKVVAGNNGAMLGGAIGFGVGELTGIIHGISRGIKNVEAAQEDHTKLTTELAEKDKFVKLLTAQDAAKGDPTKGGRGA